MVYTVYYKNKNSLFWKKIKNVEGDFIPDDIKIPTRVIMLEDRTRIEIPLENMMFKFSKERFLVIKLKMEKESGQKLNV